MSLTDDVDGDQDPPIEAIELVTIQGDDGAVIYHPDELRMTTEWIEWDGEFIRDIREWA